MPAVNKSWDANFPLLRPLGGWGPRKRVFARAARRIVRTQSEQPDGEMAVSHAVQMTTTVRMKQSECTETSKFRSCLLLFTHL